MKKGFTLIELLAAVLVIGVLSSIALPKYRTSVERSRIMEGIQMLPSIYDSLQRWQADNPSATALPSWDLLDISLKGKEGPSYTTGAGTYPVWLTANFAYLVYYASNGLPVILASVRRGKYAGSLFLYDPIGRLGIGPGGVAPSGYANVHCAPPIIGGVGRVVNACELMGYDNNFWSGGQEAAEMFITFNVFEAWTVNVKNGLYDDY